MFTEGRLEKPKGIEGKEEDDVASHTFGALRDEDMSTPGLETPLVVPIGRESTNGVLNTKEPFFRFPKESLPVLDERFMES